MPQHISDANTVNEFQGSDFAYEYEEAPFDIQESCIQELSMELREAILHKDISKLTEAIFKIKEKHITSMFDITYAEQKLVKMIEESKQKS